MGHRPTLRAAPRRTPRTGRRAPNRARRTFERGGASRPAPAALRHRPRPPEQVPQPAGGPRRGTAPPHLPAPQRRPRAPGAPRKRPAAVAGPRHGALRRGAGAAGRRRARPPAGAPLADGPGPGDRRAGDGPRACGGHRPGGALGHQALARRALRRGGRRPRRSGGQRRARRRTRRPQAFAAFRAARLRPGGRRPLPLPVDALAAALALCRLLVTCDSGPVHLASAVGTPALALFGPTSPVRWAPAPPGRALSLGLPCAPCSNHGGETCPMGHHRCLGDLGADTVAAAAREMLG
jgi:hypothetical protein